MPTWSVPKMEDLPKNRRNMEDGRMRAKNQDLRRERTEHFFTYEMVSFINFLAHRH